MGQWDLNTRERYCTCRDVQHVSGLLSVRFFFPVDLSNVELTLVAKIVRTAIAFP